VGLICPPSAGSPLRQGDLLKAPQLFETSQDGDAPSPVEGVEYVLVLSRHCNALRKPHVLVAAITEVQPEVLSTLGDSSLDETRRKLAALRDGDGTPDRFYLGTLPDREPRRAFACLDQVYVVQVPEGEQARSQWVTSRRVSTLTDAHRRQLHTRLFQAVSQEGYNDLEWWPDGDLRLAIAAGEREVAGARLQQASVVPNYEGSEGKKTEGVRKQAGKAAERLEKAQNALAPYRAEWTRRHGDRDPLA